LSALAGVLQGFHAVIAFQRSEPHWLINDDDAKRYGTALGNALRHLPIKVAQKSIDYGALVVVAFAIETPRVVRSLQLARQPAPPQRGPAQVFQFHPNPQPSQPQAAATPPPASPTGQASGGSGPPPDFADEPDGGGFGGDAA
jgi:hypothetical protein